MISKWASQTSTIVQPGLTEPWSEVSHAAGKPDGLGAKVNFTQTYTSSDPLDFAFIPSKWVGPSPPASLSIGLRITAESAFDVAVSLLYGQSVVAFGIGLCAGGPEFLEIYGQGGLLWGLDPKTVMKLLALEAFKVRLTLGCQALTGIADLDGCRIEVA